MKYVRSAFLLVGCAALGACADDIVQPQAAGTEPVSSMAASVTEISEQQLVIFRNRMPAGFAAKVEQLGGSVELTMDVAGAALVSGLDAAGVAALARDSEVVEIGPDPMLTLIEPTLDPLSLAQADAVPASQANPAGSFFFPRQWHLRAISADVAWSAGHLGAPDVTVAILDTGIGYIHADLAGLVDLSRSASFVPSDDAVVAAAFPGAHPVADLHYHGTHVAATVASMGLAAAGVTSRTTLMGVKVCSRTGSCPGSAVLAGIEHAIVNGADVINMSLGGGFLKRSTNGFVGSLNRLFNYANREGVLIVVAAGNEASDLDREWWDPTRTGNFAHYPSLFKTYCDAAHVVCVSATGPTAAAGVNGPWTNVDAPAPYTNYGRSSISVAAPGGSAASVTAACSSFSLNLAVCRTGTYVVGVSGTSMASPHVAGLAAMILGQRGGLRANQVATILKNSADDLGQPGADPWYGRGRINAARALGVD